MRNETNKGFARSCNHGARTATGKYLLFLNNDTEVQPGWFSPLFTILEKNPHIGIVGPKLTFSDGFIQHCGKIWKDIRGHLSQPHHIYYRAPGNAPFVNESREYQALTGACIMLRRSEFLDIGPFDEKYENGWEDDDLCYAYRAVGKQSWYCAESTIIHHQSMTLNTKIREAELVLIEHRRRKALVPEHTAAGMHAKEQTLISDLEQKLLGVRERFLRNRERFFSKWGHVVERDDYHYYRRDGLPFVSIVILTFNQLDKTRDCLKSIQRHTPELHEIIVVDNGSTDSTLPWLKEACACNDSYMLIENTENRGFAAGCNQGIAAARGDYVLLLNNDVVVTKDWLGGLLECLRATPDSGIVGPMTNNISGIQQVPDVRYSSTAELDAFAAQFRERNRHQRIPYRRIVGFCMLFRKSLTDEIGMLDEAFGTGNFEDDDLCLRAAIAGYRNVIAGDVFIHHVGNASFRGNNFDYVSTLTGNGRLFREKWSRPVTDEQEGKKIITLKTLEKADSLFQRGDHDGMIETILQEGIRQISGENRFYLALAGYLLDLGRHKDAFDVLAELPESCREETRHVLTGRALSGMGRLEEALSQGEAALRMNARSAQAYHLLGLLAESQGQPNQAEFFWKKALECDPGYGEPSTSLGMLAVNSSHNESGLDLLEQGFLLSPLVSETILRYHTAASASGEYERAEILFREKHRIYPQHRTIHFLLIDLLIRQKKTAEALTEIEEACVVFGSTDGMLAAGLELRRSIGPMSIPVEKQDSGTSVSLCMIMKNEQDNLARCLKSLKPVVDEIIITDTGSTDHSREIAELFGARLFEFPWNGDFSTARNVSLEHATGNWILVMDADEVISVLDHSRFRQLVSNSPPEGVAYDIVTRNYMFNINLEKWRPNDGLYPEEAGAGWTPSNKVRLFPSLPGIRFENPVHEMVDLSIAASEIPILQTDIPVHHYGYLDKERQKRKGEEYYLLGKKKLEQNGDNDFRALCELAVQAAGIGRYQEAIDLWQRVLAINSSYPLALFNLGYAFLQLGQFDKSRTASAKAMDLNPQLFEAVNNFAICEICIGSNEEAIRVLEASLKKRPDDANSLVMHAVALLCAGEIEAGRNIFQRLTDSGVEYAEFINEATKKLFQAGKANYARALLETAILLRAGNEETGRLLREFGETS
ncbi:MAG: glycosyltransferase [Deltaproteobacteria bacterium]|nr:glycosyltransferase [Deltaproteobacteria bacterium]